MSTRATLTVRDEPNGNEAYSIYRHCDGYPDTECGVFADLRKALPYAWPLPRYEAMDFAAAIIAAWKSGPRVFGGNYTSQGGNIYMTQGRDAHGDTEYHYELWPDGKGRVAVQCYSATYPNGYDANMVWKPYGRVRYLTKRDQPVMKATEPV